MPSIRRRNNRCMVIYRDHQGKQRSAGSFKSEAEARKTLRVTRDGVTPVTEAKTYSSKALGSYAPVWLAGHQLEPRTRQSYRQVTGKWIIPYLGGRPISKITKADIRAWVSQMTSDGAGAAVVHKAVRVLSGMFATALEEDLIKVNPCKGSQAATSGYQDS